jgi:hypothetical protein
MSGPTACPGRTTSRSSRGLRLRTGYWFPPTRISAVSSLREIRLFLPWCSAIEKDVDAGAIAVIEDQGVRIRRLPIGGT